MYHNCAFMKVNRAIRPFNPLRNRQQQQQGSNTSSSSSAAPVGPSRASVSRNKYSRPSISVLHAPSLDCDRHLTSGSGNEYQQLLDHSDRKTAGKCNIPMNVVG